MIKANLLALRARGMQKAVSFSRPPSGYWIELQTLRSSHKLLQPSCFLKTPPQPQVDKITLFFIVIAISLAQ